MENHRNLRIDHLAFAQPTNQEAQTSTVKSFVVSNLSERECKEIPKKYVYRTQYIKENLVNKLFPSSCWYETLCWAPLV